MPFLRFRRPSGSRVWALSVWTDLRCRRLCIQTGDRRCPRLRRRAAPAACVQSSMLSFTALGLLSMRFPELPGNGKGSVQLGFQGEMALGTACTLLALKVAVICASLRAGAMGGLPMPGLACGALLTIVCSALGTRPCPALQQAPVRLSVARHSLGDVDAHAPGRRSFWLRSSPICSCAGTGGPCLRLRDRSVRGADMQRGKWLLFSGAGRGSLQQPSPRGFPATAPGGAWRARNRSSWPANALPSCSGVRCRPPSIDARCAELVHLTASAVRRS